MGKILNLAIVFCLCLFSKNSWAGQATVGADLIQPILLSGWNINGFYYFDSGLTVGWSHGENLKVSFNDSFASNQIKDARATALTDWSTGPEVGYRFGKFWDVRVDLKAHYNIVNFESRPDSISYTSYTLGPSVFYNWYPFSNDAQGFLVQTSARYWFYLSDDLNDDNFSYIDKNGETKIHKSDEFWDGGLSGFGVNLAIGYTF